jgi:hypothetical protein
MTNVYILILILWIFSLCLEFFLMECWQENGGYTLYLVAYITQPHYLSNSVAFSSFTFLIIPLYFKYTEERDSV